MTLSIRKYALAAGTFATLALMGFDASAVTIRVTCEVRPDRSKISVDGKNVPGGRYTTVAVSGSNMATSRPTAAVRGEIETDYDSDPGDIRQGATPIPSTFITGGSVTGKIVDANGNTVIADTVACRVRNH
ncbi:MAG: hypothetical protein JSR59_09040 [Proteobacteria bacterium]|nr:hypothetical protein [Pseudomonadota bacterium]